MTTGTTAIKSVGQTAATNFLSLVAGSHLSASSSRIYPLSEHDGATSGTPQPLQVLKTGPASSGPKKRAQRSLSIWLLDAVYYICPDCSLVQCSTILAGLLLTLLLTLLFLHLGGYWQSALTRRA